MSQAQEKIFHSLLERTISVIVVFGLLAVFNVSQILSVSALTFDEGVPNLQFISEGPSFPPIADSSPRRIIYVVATGYSLESAQTDNTPCIPANGENLCDLREKFGFHDTVAANFLRLGTKVKIPDLLGDRVLTARDRMNSRYNGTNRIDIVFDTREDAIQFGVRYLKMEIY